MSRLIGDIRSELIEAVVNKGIEKGWNQQQLANLSGMSRGALNRRLSGEDELTLRSIADLAWALEKEIHFELRDPRPFPGQNSVGETSATADAATSRFKQNEIVGRSCTKAIRTFVAKPRADEEE